jgi:DNA end-binding protein Ku
VAANGDRPPQARAFWSGTITFGLVSIPVDLFTAVRPHRVSMRMLSPDGHPLTRRYVCSRDEKPLESDEIVRGYPADGEYVVVSDDELESLEPRKSRDIDLKRFVPRDEIDPMLLERPYILAPAGQSTKAYHLLAATMERTGRAGIATFVMRGTEYLVAIFADHGVLQAQTLRFVDELRTPQDVGLPKVRKPAAQRRKTIEAAMKKLERRTLDKDLLRDEETTKLLELAERKRAESRDVVEVPEVPPEGDEDADNVIDLMTLLKERIGSAGPSRAAVAPKRKPARRATSRRKASRSTRQHKAR